ncbi:glutamine-hydrolyzing GMP synthase [Candidatus Spongiihabitans sp.]|uniref:glutamine-hydrolyzing GMP synthase n=1 Tax=Candidatus Spongiihabitans sp. TaxID=3101308 RepID=UPI003C6FCE39
MNTFHDPQQKKILILDFGAQYTQLIGRCVRELGVYCEIFPFDVDSGKIKAFAANGFILSGSHASTCQDHETNAPGIIFDTELPILGICYGMQTLVSQLGGVVENTTAQEYGYAENGYAEYGHAVVNTCANSKLCGPAGQVLTVWMSHGDRVSELPAGFKVIGATSRCPYAIVADEDRDYYGVQFHPEVTHTVDGKRILSRFVHDICGCGADWVSANIIESQLQWVKNRVGNEHVILGLSGGVDSAVVAALLHRAIGAQLTCIFVDTGLLRLYEGDQVMETFSEHLGVKVIRVNAAGDYFKRLKDIDDPEQKRKIIGNLFIEIFERESRKIKNAKWLAQGTIYPDVIESSGNKHGKAKVIKSHHNVGGLPADMNLKLLEPLRELFKDEVRNMGLTLGLPKKIVCRHPFPGPGLGVRILGEVKQEYAEILRQADAIFLEQLYAHDLYDEISQAFAVFLPIKSVGVVGDNRAYEYVIALRAVETVDFMTANWKRIPHDVLSGISNRIINEVRGISRVVYDISGKPPATIEWE